MVGALWTGISGLAAQQTALDNESNNISNVNTIGYKSSRISFADQMYQDSIGKGTLVIDSEKLYKQGNLKGTGVSYDMALSGIGFFAVSNTRGSGLSEVFYTRAGNFRMGENGKLQDGAGNEVQGWAMSPLETANITSTNENVTGFSDAYNKLASSKIIRGTSSIQTITAKMTDYTSTAKADSIDVFSGAGYKSQSAKIADVESLITSYSAKLTAYAAKPDATSTPSTAQKSWIDYDADDTTDMAEGDQIYVYINGTKWSQTFDTDEITTIKKLTDKLSQIPGINAFMGDSTTATTAKTTSDKGIIIIESLVPGDSILIGDVGFTKNGTTTLKSTGTNTKAVSGTGYSAVESAMTALKNAVSGKQRDVWASSTTFSDYSLTDSTGTTTKVSASTVDDMVTAINADATMKKYVIATNIGGNLVVESKVAGQEFASKLEDGGTLKTKTENYSISSGAGSEFLQMVSTIDQTASQSSIQLRLDTLKISDSAFGNFEVDSSGLITMKQDGVKFAIGQVSVALFNDTRGLEPIGGNLLKITGQSGAAIYNINNNKTADVHGKTLELSTADLSESLVNLMVFQRAFEANAKSITTADTILNTLIQLKR